MYFFINKVKDKEGYVFRMQTIIHRLILTFGFDFPVFYLFINPNNLVVVFQFRIVIF